MSLSEEARERLADVVELQPTKNAELQERWGLESGSEVHGYLESELKEFYYRNDDSLICATPEAVAIVTGEDVDTVERTITVTALQSAVVDALPGPEEEPRSVVATFHAVRQTGEDPTVDEVRSALHSLVDKGIVERVERTVPTFRLALARENVTVEEATDS